ncbi:MAG: hypothetical protein M1829_000633 [Trizodia sp. TS-e1964]|nr:MAG: hypothetical protein M1829_000633 [Trizodia sp. TS-e1964]
MCEAHSELSQTSDSPSSSAVTKSQVGKVEAKTNARHMELDEFGLSARKFESVELEDAGLNEEISIQGNDFAGMHPDKGSANNTELEEDLQDHPERYSTPLSDFDHLTADNDESITPSAPVADEHISPSRFSEPLTDGKHPKHVQSEKTETSSRKEDTAIQNSPSKGVVVNKSAVVSEWSHQQPLPQNTSDEHPSKEEDEWQDMPAFAPFNLYDDDGKLIAREAQESDDEAAMYDGLGGAGKGYTRVNIDDDAQSATSMDENTKYLFKETGTNLADEDEESRDQLAQMQATKDLLTEGQRIAYVGLARLAMVVMIKELGSITPTKGTKKELLASIEAMKMWSQKMTIRLYAHMDVSPAEQLMIEQLADHGVEPGDLTHLLTANSRSKQMKANIETDSSIPSSPGTKLSHPERHISTSDIPQFQEKLPEDKEGDNTPDPVANVRVSENLDTEFDLRWTVLCDLFLILIEDQIYDSRSRLLLERVGASLEVPWLEICRFEKRITDALEMQEAANKENWNEDEHMENRRKMAIKRRIMMMGLATVGGGLVIGLSAGLLAPVIGAGLAAGFTTIGVAGTSGFLAGAGGAALITTTGAVSGGAIAVKASARRTGAVRTFEYRPLHNNKRVNLVVTVSGWMNGKIDDVRLPYSTVDPIMGDIYSVLWEPEMLQSMGQTINILATEALTQGLQQLLGSTVLVALMASLQLPLVLTKLSYLIDNPWTVSLDRAQAAGLIFADSLIDRNLGTRPITLVGYSLGSRLIFSCLRELAKRGAFGIVQNVYLFGSPIVVKKDEYILARSVVSGRFVNGYSRNDWILGYLFRATSGGIMRVAGLAPIEGIQGLENIEVTSLVDGHMAYRAAMPRLLREMGWTVESDEFVEIEDPDPENHQQRQRELINELDEARKEASKDAKKGKFSFFGRSKKIEKKEWETYEESSKDHDSNPPIEGCRKDSGVLFDVDAIKAELAKEHIEVRQLESTLPPMRLDIRSPSLSPHPSPLPRSHKSFDDGAIRSSPGPTAPSPFSSEGLSLFHSPNLNTEHSGWTSYEEGQENMTMTFDLSHKQSSIPDQDDRAASPYSTEHNPFSVLPVRMASLDHNAWLDDAKADDMEESNMTMTFE